MTLSSLTDGKRCQGKLARTHNARLVFGPREGIALNDGAKSGADAPVAFVLGGEKKVAEGLGVAVQGEVNGSGKTTVNGGFVIGVGEVTKPVGVQLFNWDPLKKKDEE